MIALLLAALLTAPGSHPDSLSRSQIRVDGERATLELRFQALSLIEVLPELDFVPDGRFDAQEIVEGRAAIEAYLRANLRLLQHGAGGEQVLEGVLEALTPEPDQGGAFDLQQVDARFVFRGQGELSVLTIESHLFHETNPWHKDLSSVAWNGATPVYHTFEGSETRWLFEPAHLRRSGVFAIFVRLGVEHILGGYDHLAFLLALFVAARRPRSLVLVVTAFTGAHSLTLIAAALGWVHLPSRFVELAIALSIAYVGCENLLRKEARDPWIEALGFGLLHGLGFAGFLADALAGEPLVLTALVAFNLGVELGQLGAVLTVLLLTSLVFRSWKRRGAGQSESAGLVPRALRLATSAVIALFGFFWFVERAGWLG